MHFPAHAPTAAASSSPSISGSALALAIVGIVGTLLGALLTQWLTTRREDRKWKREREQDRVRWERERRRDDMRWERERAERREQWDREDAARWQRDQLAAYSDLLAAIENWLGVASRSGPLDPRRTAITTGAAADLDDAWEAIDKKVSAIELLAPEPIRARARWLAGNAHQFARQYSAEEIFLEGREGHQLARDVDAFFDAYGDRLRELRARIREHLQIELE